MRTTITSYPESASRRHARDRRSRHEPRRWRGRPEIDPRWRIGYSELTRRPLPSLAFVLPILLTYECGVIVLGGSSAEALRTGADYWLRQGLMTLGLADWHVLPVSLVLAMLGWQAVERGAWRFGPGCLMGMLVESLLYAVGLIGLSKLIDLGLIRLEDGWPAAELAREDAPDPGQWLGFLGAGLYEEGLFRLALIPALYGIMRLIQTPSILAGTLAVTASSVLFALAHHAGAPGEPFAWYAFLFRWAAGVYFAWVFVVRGFGIAVGTHAAYDILVGTLGWHF